MGNSLVSCFLLTHSADGMLHFKSFRMAVTY